MIIQRLCIIEPAHISSTSPFPDNVEIRRKIKQQHCMYVYPEDRYLCNVHAPIIGVVGVDLPIVGVVKVDAPAVGQLNAPL